MYKALKDYIYQSEIERVCHSCVRVLFLRNCVTTCTQFRTGRFL